MMRIESARYFVAVWAIWHFLAAGATAEIQMVAREIAPPHFQLNLPGHSATILTLRVLSAEEGDSSWLVSAGMDKVGRVWQLVNPVADGARSRAVTIAVAAEPTAKQTSLLRWQIGPGPKGVIYSLAVRPRNTQHKQGPLVAMAGKSVMGSAGNIVLLNPETGETIHLLDGHRQTVTALDFSPNGRRLASTSSDGQTLVWTEQVGRWTSREIVSKDAIPNSPFRPNAFLGNRHVLVADAHRDPRRGGPNKWTFRPVDIGDRDTDKRATVWKSSRPLTGDPSIAASADGHQFALGATRSTALHCWKYQRPKGWVTKDLEAPLAVRSLAYSDDNAMLAVGSLQAATGDQQSRLVVWDTNTWEKRLNVPAGAIPVTACDFTHDSRRVAYCGGAGQEIRIRDLGDKKTRTLRGPLKPVTRVAFEDKPGSYRVAWTTGSGPRFDRMSDLTRLQHSAGDEVPAGPWRRPTVKGSTWRAVVVDRATENERASGKYVQIRRGGKELTRIEFDPAFEDAESYCWIPDAQGRYRHLAVGTSRANHIYVYAVPARPRAGEAWPRLRQFRGHTDRVLTVSVSADGKYLVSGGADGTLRFWSLAGLGDRSLDMWGARFASRGAVVTIGGIEKAGPLYRRGVRDGDVLREFIVPSARGDAKTESNAKTMPQRLLGVPRNRNIEFRFERAGRVQAAFQTPPAWPPLASMVWTVNREWSVWTPAGYYAASSNGDSFFGWQIDRGPDETPDYVPASGLWRQLERKPAIMKLLSVGNLADALAGNPRSNAEPPPGDVLVGKTPSVRIITKFPRGWTTRKHTIKVEVKVGAPSYVRLTSHRLFASGIPGKLLGQTPLSEDDSWPSGWRGVRLEWEVQLPPEERIELWALAGGSVNDIPLQYGSSRRLIKRRDIKRRQGRLYVFSAGVNDYKVLNDVNFAEQDADDFTARLEARGKTLFQRVHLHSTLRGKDVTVKAFQQNLQDFVRLLQREQVGPEDLVVVFLAGHGLEQHGKYYFAAQDAQLPNGNQIVAQNLIPAGVFESLALDVPCRKLALLDTCRNGTEPPIGPIPGLGIAQREFQDNMIFTFNACEYGERAFEHHKFNHGLFTKALLDALEGAADNSKDHQVDLYELVAYVEQTVPSMAKKLGFANVRRQHPTFSPSRLLDTLVVPVSRSRPLPSR